MKKVLCILLSLALCLSIPVVAFADDTCDCGNAPVVLVHGFGSPMYTVNEDGTQGELISLTTEDVMTLIPDLLSALVKLQEGDDVGFAQDVKALVDVIAANLYCNPDGTSVADIAVGPNTAADPEIHLRAYNETDPDAEIYETVYTFHQDWRLDPLYSASLLDAYIQEIKAATGHDKIVLMAHSQGNIIATSYLAEYGTDDVEKVIFTSPAYQGLRLVGQLYTRDISIKGKTSALTSFLDTFMRLNADQQTLVNILGVLDEAGILDVLVAAVDLFLDSTLDALYAYVLIDMFATMPGIWGFVPDEYYEEAKEVMLQKEEYAAIIPVIDEYHYGVQTRLPEILADLETKNIPFYIVAGYGIDPIPVYEDAVYQSDMLIDTDYMSVGATCAKSGELLSYEGDTLPQYFSPDLMIDASTCLYPDRTWFLRYQGHLDMCAAYKDFIAWLISTETQATVFDSDSYSQFMQCNVHDAFVPITEPEVKDERSYFKRVLDAIVQFFKEAFEKLFADIKM